MSNTTVQDETRASTIVIIAAVLSARQSLMGGPALSDHFLMQTAAEFYDEHVGLVPPEPRPQTVTTSDEEREII